MRYIRFFEGYFDPLYKEISYEEAQNFTRESVRKNIKESITKDDYVKIHRFMYKMFDIYPISKINNESKEDFEIEAKVNAKYIYGDREQPLLYKSIKDLLDDGRIYFYIKKSNPHNYPKYIGFDISLYKIEGETWILNFDGKKYYQLEGIEGLEDLILNNQFEI